MIPYYRVPACLSNVPVRQMHGMKGEVRQPWQGLSNPPIILYMGEKRT